MSTPPFKSEEIDRSVTTALARARGAGSAGETSTSTSSYGGSVVRIQDAEHGEPIEKSGAVITIDKLYPDSDALSPELGTALNLLREALDRIESATESADAGDLITADNEILRVRALLPELFCCRSLGDGFGAVISAVYHSTQNVTNKTLNDQQIRAVGKVLSAARSEPFMSFEKAVDLIEHLEGASLNPTPAAFTRLVDLLEEQSLR